MEALVWEHLKRMAATCMSTQKLQKNIVNVCGKKRLLMGRLMENKASGNIMGNAL